MGTTTTWVAWLPFRPNGQIGRWSKFHAEKSDEKTMCGLRIPPSGEVLRYEYGGSDTCKTCEKKVEAL